MTKGSNILIKNVYVFYYFYFVQTMESNVYEKVQEYFTLIGRAELLTCAATQASYSKIKEQAQKV